MPRQSSDRRFRNSFMGMFAGTPLGVCVNCVAPIAKGMYEGGSKMETALAVMFSSPTLNIIVLTMLFSIFPFYMAVMKLLATFLLILIIVPLISEKTRAIPEKQSSGYRPCFNLRSQLWSGNLGRWLSSLQVGITGKVFVIFLPALFP